MNKTVLVACLALAGCGTYPEVAVKSPTAIQLLSPPAQQQAAENIADAHCAKRGTVARMTFQSFAGNAFLVGPVDSYRYECEQPPKVAKSP